MESLKQRIEDLSRELSLLKEERDRLNLEAREWLRKRNSIHEQIRGLRAKAAGLEEKRDALNERVQELKSLREQAKMQSKNIHAQILKLKEKVGIFMEKRLPRDMREIERKIESLDWKIQTTPLTLEEERSLVNQVRLLEAQLSIHKQIQVLDKSLVELKAEKKALEVKAKHYHEELSEFAEQSQKFHKKMVDVLKKVHVFRVEANRIHQKYMEAKQQAQEFHQRHAEISHQVSSLKQVLHRAEDEKQAQRQLELRKELKEKALKKLKHGEKLSWEEFKILAEQGVVQNSK